MAGMEKARVILQPNQSAYCAFYALVNLYRAVGLEPPSLEAMFDLDPLGERTGGLSIIGAWALLGRLGFPGLVSFGVVPKGQELDAAIKAQVDDGFTLLLAYIAEWQGERYKHAAVLERCWPDGVEMYCSVMGKMFAPYTTLPFEWMDAEQQLLPVVEVSEARGLRGIVMPFGFLPSYLAVKPLKKRLDETLIITGGNSNGNGKRI